jgi:protein-histidine N-methyltransferase
MFKFNFDVEDDGDQSMGSLGGNCATRNHRPASAQAVVPDVFTELSLADAVCPNTA